ncbi:MAG: hypothetical protein JSV18_06185 [Candidatus Bathyarchaeota archaeon]|nr:MAG: hypothetical protein JSV18_06185 [Candidatus Bathyarchaeota archaeon]
MRLINPKKEAWILMLLAMAINLLIIYGLVTRPVIAYHLSTPLDYNGTIDFGTQDLPVTLHVENRGRSSTHVDLSLRLYNTSLIGSEGAEVVEGEGFTFIRMSLDGKIDPSRQGNKSITINTVGDATYIVLILSAQSQRSSDPLRGFYDSFAINQPERPTALLLKQVEGFTYQRVTSR